jgi:hypothetical protein
LELRFPVLGGCLLPFIQQLGQGTSQVYNEASGHDGAVEYNTPVKSDLASMKLVFLVGVKRHDRSK